MTCNDVEPREERSYFQEEKKLYQAVENKGKQFSLCTYDV